MTTLLLAVCLPAAPAVAAEGSCENAARRTEQSSTYLPDCRAYEQVTPVAKDSGEPAAVRVGLAERNAFEPIRGARAAVDGDRMAWVSEYSLPAMTGPSTPGLDYLSTRGSEGWSTEATFPPQSPENGVLCPNLNGIVGWSSNLTKGILNDGDAQEDDPGEDSLGPGSGTFNEQAYGCGHAEPALKEAGGAEIKEPRGFQNLFLRDSETATYQLINVTPAVAPQPTPDIAKQDYFPPNFLAGSPDLAHVAFEDELPLTEEAEKLSPTVEAACKEEPKGRLCWEGHDDIYVWSEARQPAVRLVTVLPDGNPVEGALAGSTRNAGVSVPAEEIDNVADYRHAMSADGSRIFFEAEGNLYVRENGSEPQSALGAKGECTEAAKACTIQLDLPQGGKGTAGGGKWLGANAEGTKVFFTDEASKGLTSTTIEGSGANLYEYQLTSVPDTSGTLVDLTPAASAEVLGMSGVSEGGSYVYFVAEGKLAGNYNVVGRSSAQPEPSEGADNLYVSHEGAITFIGTLSGEDLCDWTSNAGCNLAEPGNPQITGLTARVSGNGRYLAFNSANQLTGYDNTDTVTKKVDEEIFTYEAEDGHLACVSCNPDGTPSAGGAAIDWPAQTDTNSFMRGGYPQRNVSEAGQVFFETSEALLPQQDTNGLRDIYEYERGTLHLISSGTSSAPSYFLDATPSGSDVFFATAQKLLPRDTESTYDIYDARVGGGFPEPLSPTPPCENECKGSAGAFPVFSAPSSATFTGLGNVVQAKTSTKPKPDTAKHKLRACRKRYLHNEHRRARCEQRARASRRAEPRRAAVIAGGAGR